MSFRRSRAERVGAFPPYGESDILQTGTEQSGLRLADGFGPYFGNTQLHRLFLANQHYGV